MITERDRIILKHINEFGYITLKQVEDIAYNTISYGYDYARRRMNKLKEQNNLKSCRSKILNSNIYYFDESKKNPSLHKNLMMEYYCKLIRSNANIEYFQKERVWADGTDKRCISDVVCIYTLGNTRFHNLVEVNISNNKLNLKRFEYIIDEFRTTFNTNCIPTLVLIDDTEHSKYDTNLNVVRINYNMSNIAEIFI